MALLDEVMVGELVAMTLLDEVMVDELVELEESTL